MRGFGVRVGYGKGLEYVFLVGSILFLRGVYRYVGVEILDFMIVRRFVRSYCTEVGYGVFVVLICRG